MKHQKCQKQIFLLLLHLLMKKFQELIFKENNNYGMDDAKLIAKLKDFSSTNLHFPTKTEKMFCFAANFPQFKKKKTQILKK